MDMNGLRECHRWGNPNFNIPSWSLWLLPFAVSLPLVSHNKEVDIPVTLCATFLSFNF